jgi:hypothetical protein
MLHTTLKAGLRGQSPISKPQEQDAGKAKVGANQLAHSLAHMLYALGCRSKISNAPNQLKHSIFGP